MNIDEKQVSIVILTWNGVELTKKCLDSLFLSNDISKAQVIVVDNGSTDGTLDYLNSLKDRITVIENNANLGYAKAVNIGIKSAGQKSDIILLNNDVELTDQNWLSALKVRANSEKELGVLGVKILKNEDELQHCGAYLPLDTCWGQQIAGGEVDLGQYEGLHYVESVVFACAYIKSEVIDKVGLLDEDFFAYFEDTDYCLRATLAGFKVGMDGNIRIQHAENSSTKVNKVSHSDIFLKSQQTFKDKWGKHFESERYNKGSLDFHSIVNLPTGYATSAKCYMLALDELGTRVSYQYVYGKDTVFPVDEPEMSDSYVINMLSAREFGQSPIQLVYGQGDIFYKNSGKYKIGATMLEVDGLPEEWVRQANEMDEVWVPSEFNRITFQNSGVTKPIHVIPLGVDPSYFSPNIRSERFSDSYTFLSIFEWGTRKAPDLLLRAFTDEFSEYENVLLVCKVNNFDGSIDLNDEIKALGLRQSGGKVRIIQNKIMSGYEMGVLYNAADCFVLPTRGEGWGMPILEAMACGLPTIATNWSAQTEFMNESNSLPLDVEQLIPAVAKCPYYDGFNWAEPSYEHLRKLMRWAFENQNEAREIGIKASQDARNNWTWQKASGKIADRLNAIEARFEQK